MWQWKGVAWSLVLVLVPMVWGQDCVSEDVQIWKFPVGENATISVKGDMGRGCKFVLQNDETKSCCYMNKIRQQNPEYNMCRDQHQSENCIDETHFTVEEPRGQEKCVLKLIDFRAGYAGQYHVEFPGERRKFNKIKRVEIMEKTIETRRIDVGKSTTIFIKGDMKGDNGCKFVAKVDSKTCCYESNKTRMLCREEEITAGCKGQKVTEEGKNCVLHLKDFQTSDAGEYKAIFPSDPNDNEIILVIVSVGRSVGWLEFGVIIAILAAAAISFVIWKFIQITNNEIVNRSWMNDQISKDKAIFDTIRLKETKKFKEKLGTKSILKVSDHYKNNIFHLAANEGWTKEMADIVVSHCRKTFPHLEAIAWSSTDTEVLAMVPWTKYDIFSAKIPDPKDWLPAWFPRRLLPNHINLNTQNSEGMTPLHIAAGKNLENAVMSLLKNGANANILDNDGYSALQKAILFHHCINNSEPANMQTIRNLLGKNPNLDSFEKAKLTATEKGQTPVHSAVLKNNLQCIKLLLEEHNSENPKHPSLLKEKWEHDNFCETPIELAVRLGYIEIVKYILDECDTYWRQAEGHHVMKLISGAAAGGHSKIVDLLLEDKYKEVFDSKYKIGEDTCLERAIKAKNPVAVNILLGKMVDVDVGQSVSLTEQLIEREEANNKSINIGNKTEAQIKSGQISRQKEVNLSLHDTTKLEEEKETDKKIWNSFKDIGNLNKIKSALQKHISRAQGNLVTARVEKEKEKEKLSEETLIKHFEEIMASENRLSQRQIIHLQKIMNGSQFAYLGEQT